MKITACALALAALAAELGLAPFPARAAAPEPTAVTPALIAAAEAEGKVVFYTAIDIVVAAQIAKSFEAAYPGIAVQVERNGGERIAQRIAQERASNIFAVDVLDSSDTAQFITWQRLGWLEPFVPAEVAASSPPRSRPAGISAGPISRSSDSNMSCRCNRLPNRPRSWQWASVPSRPTASNMSLST